jgi:hypothetical protein
MVLGGYGQDPELRRMLKMEDIFRQRLELDGLSEFMWNSTEIQNIIAQEQQAAMEAQERQMEMALRLEQQKFDNAVLKKSEVQATKEEIKKERDVEEAVKEQETLAMMQGLKSQAKTAKATEAMKKVQESLDAIKAARDKATEDTTKSE